MLGNGLRYNEGKQRYDLVHPDALSGLVDVLTVGAKKYAERNWENGMKWSNVIASMKRHLAAIEKGEDYDKESLLLHADHIQANAHFLSAYYRIYPQGDDRRKFFDRRVGLDIDGVIADWNTAAKEYIMTDKEPHSWYYSYEFRKAELWDKLKNDKDFWLNIKPYDEKMPFEPVCYVTQRPIPKDWVEEWIEKNNFPCVPVVVVDGSKVEAIKKFNVDIYIDDRYTNFVDLTNNGIFTFLMDRPWNQYYDVGHRRIYSLKDVL